MRGVVAAAETDGVFLRQPLADRRAKLGPDGFQRVADRRALRERLRIENEFLVRFAGPDEIAPLLIVLVRAAAAGDDEAVVLHQQRQIF